MQRSLLPQSLPPIEGFQVAARYVPGLDGGNVGGDFYDVLRLPNGSAGLAVGDVAGKGTRAATIMGKLRTALAIYAAEGARPSDVLTRLDHAFSAVGDEDLATLLYMTLDPANGAVRYSSAAHCPPLVVAPGGRAEFLEGARSVPLASVPDAHFHNAEAQVPEGAALVLYTDGLVDRPGTRIETGFARLLAAAAHAPGSPEALADHLLLEMLRKKSRADDVALLVARRWAA